jgi:hypothetical protein
VADDNSYNVVEAHHKKNRAPKPPTPEYLESTCNGSDVDDDVTSNTPGSDSSNSADELEDDSRAPRHSKTPYKSRASNATQLQFYPPQWAMVLDAAKDNSRRFAATEYAFPKRRKHMKNLKVALTTAIAAHEADGGLLERGKFLASSQHTK